MFTSIHIGVYAREGAWWHVGLKHWCLTLSIQNTLPVERNWRNLVWKDDLAPVAQFTYSVVDVVVLNDLDLDLLGVPPVGL